MNGVERYERIAILKVDVNHNEIVNVVKVVAQTLSSDTWVNIANDEITGGTDANLICDVAWKYELAVIPRDLNLSQISICLDNVEKSILPACRVCRYHCAWHS